MLGRVLVRLQQIHRAGNSNKKVPLNQARNVFHKYNIPINENLIQNSIHIFIFSNTSMSAGSSAEPRTGSGDSGLTGNLSGNSAGSRAATSCSTGGEEDPNLILNNKANILNGAPPLPLHRYPSWEGRIYQVASDAEILTSNETTSTNTLLYGTSETVSAVGDSMNNNNETLSSEIRNLEDDHAIDYEGERDINNRLSTASLRGSIGFGSDVSVPVYTSIKGVSVFIHIIYLP